MPEIRRPRPGQVGRLRRAQRLFLDAFGNALPARQAGAPGLVRRPHRGTQPLPPGRHGWRKRKSTSATTTTDTSVIPTDRSPGSTSNTGRSSFRPRNV
ncbi:MAG: hypothetical protein MZU84_07355 [Sphingobacterium sp.]|nr:hypothetical protein [Sphingobacterium sp.]